MKLTIKYLSGIFLSVCLITGCITEKPVEVDVVYDAAILDSESGFELNISNDVFDLRISPSDKNQERRWMGVSGYGAFGVEHDLKGWTVKELFHYLSVNRMVTEYRGEDSFSNIDLFFDTWSKGKRKTNPETTEEVEKQRVDHTNIMLDIMKTSWC